MKKKADITLGVIVGNRGFFPSHLCESGREAVLAALRKAGIRAVILGAKAARAGAVESWDEAKACADLFRRNRDRIDGVLVTLPNFGDERAVANTLRLAGLDVPVLVHAFADDAARMTVRHRRDSFCGKMSVCANLRQYGIPYSITALHTIDPADEAFAEELEWFAAVCRVVRRLRQVRIGVIGARPAAFNTVRFSEKILEASGISVETIDLADITGRAEKRKDSDPAVHAKLEAIRGYTTTRGVPPSSLARMARLGVVIDEWLRENDLAASAIQCWTAIEEFYGVVPCTLMSLMSEGLAPSACETDIGGVIGMLALQAASGTPSAILDWNNNYGDDPDKGVLFHCSNLPRSFFREAQMDYQAIIAGTVGKDKTFGTLTGRIRSGPFTFCRVSTDDETGEIRGYLGEGVFTDDPLETFGGYGVFEIADLQSLLAFICENGFEHHVAANFSETADPVHEALSKYLDWNIHMHDG